MRGKGGKRKFFGNRKENGPKRNPFDSKMGEKGKKRKFRLEDEEEDDTEQMNTTMEPPSQVYEKKRKFVGDRDDDVEFDLPKKHMRASHIISEEKRLIVVLEGAQLEAVKANGAFELLNCDDHMSIMRKHGKDPSACRPDILHQCLLMLFDSPLNRAGLLQVYVRSEQKVLIEINPQTRIPRTFKRFAGLMVQLLHKFQIKANESSVKLMKVIKNPITNHLPVGCRKLGMSFTGKLVPNVRELVPKKEEPIVFVIGAFAHGNISSDYIEESFSISNYPLSAAIACSKLCSAFEEVWNIV